MNLFNISLRLLKMHCDYWLATIQMSAGVSVAGTVIIIIIIWRFVIAPITVKNIGAWQCIYVWEEGLHETTWEQDCFKFSLENRETTVVWCALEVDSMPLDQNVKSPVLRISSEVAAWRNSTSRRSADEVNVMVYLPAGTCRRGTKDSDHCVHCTLSSTAWRALGGKKLTTHGILCHFNHCKWKG